MTPAILFEGGGPFIIHSPTLQRLNTFGVVDCGSGMHACLHASGKQDLIIVKFMSLVLCSAIEMAAIHRCKMLFFLGQVQQLVFADS